MSEFCNKCTDKEFGENLTPDIDVYRIFKELEPEYMQRVLCEGCMMTEVAKIDDKLRVWYRYSDKWESYE